MRRLPVDRLRSVASRLLTVGPALLLVILPLIFNPFADEIFEAPKVALFRVWVTLLAGAFLLAGIRSASSANGLDRAVALYGLTTMAATVLSIDPFRSFWGALDRHGTLTLFCLLVYYFVVSRTARSDRDASRLIRAIVLGSVPVTLYGLVQFVKLDPLYWVSDSVSSVLSTMGRSNYLGAYVAMVVPLTLSRSLAMRGRRGAWRIGLLLGMQVVVVALSQARAAWLGLVAGLFVFAALALAVPRARRSRILTAIALSGVATLMILSWVNLSPNGLGGSSFAAARAQTVRSRVMIWRCTLSLIEERWLLGHGPETFEIVFRERCPSAPTSPAMIVDDPHNIVLAELVAGGLLGAGAFSSIVVLFLLSARRCRASDHEERAFAGAWYGSGTVYLVQAQFNPDVIVLTVLFWTLLALVRSTRV